MKSKKLIALTAIVALAFLPLNANAAPTVSDYENVYVIQDSAGGIKKIISVDWLRVEGKSPFTILDPIKGAQAAEVLIGDASITQSDTGLTIQGQSNGVADVFYRTDLQKDLPFSLKLNVLINGKAAKLSDLEQATGSVEIGVEFTNYYKEQNTYLPWLVNVSLTMDGRSVKNVTVSSGNVSYVGSKAMATLMMQALGERTTATISYETINRTNPSLSISVVPTLMAVELPDMSNLKEMTKALDGMAKGIDGYSEALTKMANSIRTDMDLSSLENVAVLLDAYGQILNQMYQQLNPQQIAMLSKATEGLSSLQKPLQQTASALEQLGSLVDTYMELASQSLAINQQVSNALATQPQLQGKEQLLKLIDQQQLLLQAMTQGATLPTGFIPPLSTLKQSLTQLSQGSLQMARTVQQTASQMAMLKDLSNGLLAMRNTLGIMVNGGTLQGKKLPPIAEVSNQLRTGISTMQKELSKGMLDLKTALTTLVKGGIINGQTLPPMSELSKGLRQISNGVSQTFQAFSSQSPDLKKAKELADSYKSFNGLPTGAAGKVMFIIKIED